MIIRRAYHAPTHDNAGGTTIGLTANGHDIGGVGVPSGLKYEVPVSEHETVNLTNGAQTTTVVLNEKFVARGPNNNFTLQVQEHITINADGTVTVDRIDVSSSCQ